MRFSWLAGLGTTFVLSSCVMFGGLGEGVDPEEARLIQQLIGENCINVRTSASGQDTSKITRTNLISILRTYANTHDEGRQADVRVEGRKEMFAYNPATAMVKCRRAWVSHDGFTEYSNVSKTLVAMGGNPRIYQERLAAREEGRKPAPFAERPQYLFDEKRPLVFTWEGYPSPVYGIIKLTHNGYAEYITARLPDHAQECTGFTSRDSQSGHRLWKLFCMDKLMASGSFRSMGRYHITHGQGKDIHDRTVRVQIAPSQ